MGYMLASIATYVSLHDQNDPNWYKYQILEIISIPKLPQDTIFVGGKERTFDDLVKSIW